MCKRLYVKYLSFLSDSNKTFTFSDIVSKNPQISYSIKIRPIGAELLHANGQTDGQTDMTKLTVFFAILRKDMVKLTLFFAILQTHMTKLTVFFCNFPIVQTDMTKLTAFFAILQFCNFANRHDEANKLFRSFAKASKIEQCICITYQNSADRNSPREKNE
jgi:hypothetical protein